MTYPFDQEKEMVVKRVLKTGLRNTPVEFYDSPITPKENMILTLKRERPVWMGSDINDIRPRIVPDNIARGMVTDARPFDPVKEGGGKDFFGVEWGYEPENRGSMVKPGNPIVKDISEWEKYLTIPDLDALDWESAAKENEGLLDPERLTGTTIFSGLFERLISLADFENAAMALIDEDEQEGVHRLFDALAIFYDKLIDKLHTYFKIEHVEFHDDWGAQRSPFFSLDTCEEMIVPYLKRIVESCHKRGMWFHMHSCGKIEDLVPALIDAGVDSWGGQEINDKWMLYEKYGDKMVFTIDEKLSPALTEAEVDAFVDQIMSHMRKDRNMLVTAHRHPALKRLLYIKSRKFYAED